MIYSHTSISQAPSLSRELNLSKSRFCSRAPKFSVPNPLGLSKCSFPGSTLLAWLTFSILLLLLPPLQVLLVVRHTCLLLTPALPHCRVKSHPSTPPSVDSCPPPSPPSLHSSPLTLVQLHCPFSPTVTALTSSNCSCMIPFSLPTRLPAPRGQGSGQS